MKWLVCADCLVGRSVCFYYLKIGSHVCNKNGKRVSLVLCSLLLDNYKQMYQEFR